MSISRTAAVDHRSGGMAETVRLARDSDVFFRWATGVALAEFVVVFVAPALGILLHALILLGCVAGYLRRPDSASHRALVPLALVPIARLLGLTMPLEDLPPWSWYALAGAPLLAGGLLMASRLGVRDRIGLGRPTPVDGLSVGVGVGLGIAAGFLDVGPRFDGVDGSTVLLTIVALTLFVAAPEELVFRGLLQRLAGDAHGIAGVVMVTVLYAATFLTSFSIAVVAVMGIAGAAFAGAIGRGGTLWGTIAGHAFLVIGAGLVWPAVLA